MNADMCLELVKLKFARLLGMAGGTNVLRLLVLEMSNQLRADKLVMSNVDRAVLTERFRAFNESARLSKFKAVREQLRADKF